jgi:hypothetical protein
VCAGRILGQRAVAVSVGRNGYGEVTDSDKALGRQMALDFDATKALRRPLDVQRLVRAVVNAAKEDETVWLEWKSTLDLSSKEGQAAVARCIIGMANRMPEAANRFCEGNGYVLVGAEPGQLLGVTPVDSADLDQGLRPYLGDDGPIWSPHWVEVDGVTVLIVITDRPKWGDAIHILRKGYTDKKLRDGDIFVRRPGKTEHASSAELQALSRRLLARRAAMNLAVELHEPSALAPLDTSPDAIERWIKFARENLLKPLREHQARERRRGFQTGRPPVSAMSAAITYHEQVKKFGREAAEHAARGFRIEPEPEKRSPEEYEAQVECYLDECRAKMVSAAMEAAPVCLTPCVLQLGNLTEMNLPQVRVDPGQGYGC